MDLNLRHLALVASTALLAVSCDRPVPRDAGADEFGFTAPTAATIEANRTVLETLDFANRQDFENAARGLVARVQRRSHPLEPEFQKIGGPREQRLEPVPALIEELRGEVDRLEEYCAESRLGGTES